jgi:hypothetical protein
MCATVQEIMNGNHLWNDGMTKGNTICSRPFHGGGIKIKYFKKKAVYKGHNSYDDLQLKLSDTQRLQRLRGMFLVFITVN